VPEEFKVLVGNYWLAPAQVDFKMFYADGILKMYDPLAKMVIKFPNQNEDGFWIDEFNIFKIEFVKNNNKEVTTMLIYSNTYLKKQKENKESSHEIQSTSLQN
jgi:hypothetical protein